MDISSAYQRKVEQMQQEITKVCEFCGKEFTTTYTKKKYCNAECCDKAAQLRGRQERQRAGEEKKAICALCGKEFIRGKSRKTYCSIECASEARNVKEVYNLKRDRKKSNLAMTNEAARNAHMTYGQYKAMQYMKTMERVKI